MIGGLDELDLLADPGFALEGRDRPDVDRRGHGAGGLDRLLEGAAQADRELGRGVGSEDDPRLEAFVEQYQSGPQAPEATAGCTGTDLGTPIP